jgi:hypothetical protein
VKSLNKPKQSINSVEADKVERHRRSTLQFLSVVSGIATTFLVAPVLPEEILPDMGSPTRWLSLLALGLLASGGSGLWNSILSYLLRAKDLKEVDLKKGGASTEALENQIRELQADMSLVKTGKTTTNSEKL